MSPVDRRRVARVAFFTYAFAIVTLTHWPRLTLPETGLERTDLYVHLLVFAAWGALLHLSAFFGPTLSVRAITLRQFVAAAYVCLDEGLPTKVCDRAPDTAAGSGKQHLPAGSIHLHFLLAQATDVASRTKSGSGSVRNTFAYSAKNW